MGDAAESWHFASGVRKREWIWKTNINGRMDTFEEFECYPIVASHKSNWTIPRMRGIDLKWTKLRLKTIHFRRSRWKHVGRREGNRRNRTLTVHLDVLAEGYELWIRKRTFERSNLWSSFTWRNRLWTVFSFIITRREEQFPTRRTSKTTKSTLNHQRIINEGEERRVSISSNGFPFFPSVCSTDKQQTDMRFWTNASLPNGFHAHSNSMRIANRITVIESLARPHVLP